MKTSMFSSQVATVVIGLAVANFAHSQQVIDSPAALKNACETSAGNIVTVSQPIKVSSPTFAFSPTVVNCPCTVVLTNESKIEFEFANMQFTGAFAVQSTGKGEFVSVNSSIKAPAVTLNLGGAGSSVATSQSLLQATAGNLTMTLGQQAKMELYSTIGQSPSGAGLQASGAISINAGQNFTGSLADMTVNGNLGVTIGMSGLETLLKLGKVNFRANAGSLNITATGAKSMLEANESTFSMRDASTIRFSGSETGIKLGEIGFFGPSSTVASLGGVTITAGSSSANFGKIEMSDIRTGSLPLGGAFRVTASVNGQSGGVKMEKSQVSARGEVLFETGSLGSTEVKENRITSATRIVVKTASNGSCVASPNFALTAPLVLACTPTVTARLANVYEVTEMPNLSVYPNPSNNGTLNIRISNTDETQIMIVDLQGKVVKQWDNNKLEELSVDGLKSGVYVVQSVDKTGKKDSAKFIVD
jgi:Secretion system C-terminal sorting domain